MPRCVRVTVVFAALVTILPALAMAQQGGNICLHILTGDLFHPLSLTACGRTVGAIERHCTRCLAQIAHSALKVVSVDGKLAEM